MSSVQNKTIIRRLFEVPSSGSMAPVDELLAAESPLAPAVPAAGSRATSNESGRGAGEALHDARLARIAAHVAEEAGLLGRRS